MRSQRSRSGPIASVGVCLAALVLMAQFCVGSAEGQSSLAAPAAPKIQSVSLDVRVVRDIAYRQLEPGEDGRKGKDELDIYLPSDRSEFPVIVFVHGGAWVHGDKQRGLYRNLALNWARKGIATVMVNYRLSPGVKHPQHIRDVARAFAWTYRHIAEYGGRPDQMFLAGHSAGGHLVSLLATDESYLKAVGLDQRAIKGVVSICGVYRVHDLSVHAAMLAQAGERSEGVSWETRLLPIAAVFGSDPEVRRRASPLTHVRTGLPPFLVLYAQHDLPRLAEMAKEFNSLLQQNKCDVITKEIKGRTHVSMVSRIPRDGDPAGMAIAEFIAKHVSKN
jgi:acetyl esterase/lipase